MREEPSVDLLLRTITYYKTFEAHTHGKPEGIFVRMTCYTALYSGELIPSNEIDQFRYFSFDHVDQTSEVDHLIFNDLKQNGYIV